MPSLWTALGLQATRLGGAPQLSKARHTLRHQLLAAQRRELIERCGHLVRKSLRHLDVVFVRAAAGLLNDVIDDAEGLES